MMNKRERLEKTIAGEATDRVPVSLWRHWPGDDQRAADLARAVVTFQKTFDWDFVKVTPASSYCITDYGVQDEWRGNLEGTRVYTKHAVNRSLDWTELRPLDPTRGGLGKQLECLDLIAKGLDDDAPIIQTIFNPLAQAKNIVGKEKLIRHIRTHPDRVHSGLNIITESILRFIDTLKRSPIAGIFYAVQHASYDVLSEAEYKEFGEPYDRKILEALPSNWWFNMMHLHGMSPMFRLAAEYPVQAINWHSQSVEPDMTLGKSLCKGAVSGGLCQWDHLHQGTPSVVRDVARDVIEKTNGRRFILSSECVTLITTPQSNIWAAREVVESSS